MNKLTIEEGRATCEVWLDAKEMKNQRSSHLFRDIAPLKGWTIKYLLVWWYGRQLFRQMKGGVRAGPRRGNLSLQCYKGDLVRLITANEIQTAYIAHLDKCGMPLTIAR